MEFAAPLSATGARGKECIWCVGCKYNCEADIWEYAPSRE